MEVSGHLHAPAVSHTGKELEIPIVAGWALDPVWRLRSREKLVNVGNRTLTLQPVTCPFIGCATLTPEN
jgi:hypothetical protein